MTNLKKVAQDMKKFYNRKQEDIIEYKKDDKVWLEATNLPTKCPMKKLDNKCHGLFKILEKVGKLAYRLKLPVTWKIHNVFHSDLLTLYVSPRNTIQKKPIPLPPDIINQEKEWEVERILDSKHSRNSVKYLVRWKGYGPEDDTWEPPFNLKNTPQKLKEFHQNHPSKPQVKLKN